MGARSPRDDEDTEALPEVRTILLLRLSQKRRLLHILAVPGVRVCLTAPS
ncbi:MAG: hypothetical protein JJE41_16435 [Candidatus Heimdallarchaeota archaeon]|nr:hypothetical protein [Candidatus Heimdallarchaeota archaeon]